MKKSYKIAIVPTIQASLNLVLENKKTVFLLGWLSLLLLLCFDVLNRHFSIVYTISEFIAFSDNENFSRYLTIIIETLIIVPFIIGLYRLYILSENNLREFKYQRGIVEQKTVFKIFWYFKFYKRELLFFIPCALLPIIFLVIQNTATNMWLESLDPVFDITKTNAYIHFFIQYFISFLEALVFSVTILIWAYIAVSEKIDIKEFSKLIRLIKGNIFRIFLIGLIIYLPVYTVGLIPIFAYWIVPHNFLESVFFIRVIDTVQTILWFICLSIDIAFISLIYKGLTSKSQG